MTPLVCALYLTQQREHQRRETLSIRRSPLSKPCMPHHLSAECWALGDDHKLALGVHCKHQSLLCLPTQVRKSGMRNSRGGALIRAPPKRVRKMWAVRKISKSVENHVWHAPCTKKCQECLLTIFDGFRADPVQLAPFAVRWLNPGERRVTRDDGTLRWCSAPCAPPLYCQAIVAQILVVP